MNDILTVGLVGVGRLGSAVGQLVAEAGHRLLVADRPGSRVFRSVVETLLPAADAVPLADVVERADIVILALPQPALADLDLARARGVLLDATNAWEHTDGPDSIHRMDPLAWTERVPGVPVVKSLNHAGYGELLMDARPAGAPGRRAFAVAGDDGAAVDLVASLVDSMGFDAVPTSAADAPLLEPDGAVFGRRFDEAGLREALPHAAARVG